MYGLCPGPPRRPSLGRPGPPGLPVRRRSGRSFPTRQTPRPGRRPVRPPEPLRPGRASTSPSTRVHTFPDGQSRTGCTGTGVSQTSHRPIPLLAWYCILTLPRTRVLYPTLTSARVSETQPPPVDLLQLGHFRDPSGRTFSTTVHVFVSSLVPFRLHLTERVPRLLKSHLG